MRRSATSPPPYLSGLDALVETVSDGVITIDPRGYVRSFNSAAQRQFGYTADEIVGEKVNLLMPAPHAALHDGYLEHYLRGGECRVIGIGREVEGRRKDGSRFPLHLSVSEVESGGERWFVGVIRDRSERHRADEAMRVVSDRLRLATTAAGIGIWDWDVVEDELVWDAQMYRLYGIGPMEFSGAYEAWRAGLHPDDVAAAHAAVERALRGEQEYDTEFRAVWPDGSVHVLKASAQVQRDAEGRPLRMVGTNWDITAIREAEADLAGKNAQLEFAARYDRIASRVMLALHARGEADTAYAEVLHVLADEAGYRPLTIYVWDEPSGELRLSASLSLAPGSGAASLQPGQGLVGEAAQRRAPIFVDDGPAASLELDTGVGVVRVSTLFALPLLHGDTLLGVLAGASHVPVPERERSWLTQIADRVAIGIHAAEQYRALRLLSVELDERARTIEAQNHELAEANRMKSEFLTTMSHELRTPLNAIIGFTNILLKNKRGVQSAKELDFLARVLANAKHLLALINDILSVSKSEAGHLDLEPMDVDLRELTIEVLAEIGVSADRPGRSLTATVPDSLEPLRADRRRLKQVMINLLGNALKFTDAGAIEVCVVAEGGVPLRLDVVDSGVGIPAHALDSVMDAFCQVDSGTSRSYGGTGLGLTISRTFCRAMGFELALDSVEGEGTVAAIVLSKEAPPLRWRPPSPTGNLDVAVRATLAEAERVRPT